MKLLLIFVVCRVAFSLHDGRSSENASVLSHRVVNGIRAPKGEFPWVGALYSFGANGDGYFELCGSSLIKSKWLLTAAHCVEGATRVEVLLGAIQLQPPSDDEIMLETNEYYIHENYTNDGNRVLKNDIALIKLPEEVQFTENIKPIGFGGSIGPGKLTSLAGWGVTTDFVSEGYSERNTILFYTNLGTMTNTECRLRWPTINENHLCCRGRLRNPCIGDGGSALVVEIDGEWKQVAILSSVSTDGDTCIDHPTVYTRIEPFKTWIEDTINRNS